MAMVIDLDRMDKKALSRLPPFIAAIETGLSKLTLLFKDDADRIAELMEESGMRQHQPEVCTPAYWTSYEDSCVSRVSPEKVLRKTKGGKAKKII